MCTHYCHTCTCTFEWYIYILIHNEVNRTCTCTYIHYIIYQLTSVQGKRISFSINRKSFLSSMQLWKCTCTWTSWSTCKLYTHMYIWNCKKFNQEHCSTSIHEQSENETITSTGICCLQFACFPYPIEPVIYSKGCVSNQKSQPLKGGGEGEHGYRLMIPFTVPMPFLATTAGYMYRGWYKCMSKHAVMRGKAQNHTTSGFGNTPQLVVPTIFPSSPQGTQLTTEYVYWIH